MKKGFTLGELLAVVIILVLLGFIAIVSVSSIISSGTDKAFNTKLNEMKTAAEYYVRTEGEPSWCNNQPYCFVSLRLLAYRKYIKLDENNRYINPKTGNSFSLDTVVMIEKVGSNYKFEAFESLAALSRKYPSYAEKAAEDVINSSRYIYILKNSCTVDCNPTVNELIEQGDLEEGLPTTTTTTLGSQTRAYNGQSQPLSATGTTTSRLANGTLITSGKNYSFAYYSDSACTVSSSTPHSAGTYYAIATLAPGEFNNVQYLSSKSNCAAYTISKKSVSIYVSSTTNSSTKVTKVFSKSGATPTSVTFVCVNSSTGETIKTITFSTSSSANYSTQFSKSETQSQEIACQATGNYSSSNITFTIPKM